MGYVHIIGQDGIKRDYVTGERIRYVSMRENLGYNSDGTIEEGESIPIKPNPELERNIKEGIEAYSEYEQKLSQYTDDLVNSLSKLGSNRK